MIIDNYMVNRILYEYSRNEMLDIEVGTTWYLFKDDIFENIFAKKMFYIFIMSKHLENALVSSLGTFYRYTIVWVLVFCKQYHAQNDVMLTRINLLQKNWKWDDS